jgi:hypothetical protein
LADAYQWVGEAEMRVGDWNKGRAHLWQSLRHRPTAVKPLLLFIFANLPSRAFRDALRVKRALRRLRERAFVICLLHPAVEAVGMESLLTTGAMF